MTPHEIESAIGTLPDKLSDLLEVAVNDFEQVIKSPNVLVNMLTYCQVEAGLCVVCLAGGVIANRVGVASIVESGERISPHDLPTDTDKKLRAISAAALGGTRIALARLGFELPADVPPIQTTSKKPKKLTAQMRNLIHLLRSHGL